MASLEEIKDLIHKEIAPFNAKIAHFQTTLNELDNSVKFLSAKYDKLVTQSQSSNEKQRKVEANLEAFKKNLISVEEELDDFAQYLRRDCVEISGIPATENLRCEDIVTSLGQEMGSELDDSDISIAHFLPTFSDVKDDKVIVKFTRRETRNEFYSKRKSVAGRKASTFDSFKEHDLAGAEKKVYIGESLTPFRKKLFGAVNKIKKKLEWKFIWTNNGRIYLKQSDSSRSYTFVSGSDLNNFETKMKLPVTDTSKFKSNNKAKLKNRNT